MDWQGIFHGFVTVLQPENILFVMFGGFLGTIVGMLPGLGPATAIAVLIPVTFGMDPTSALIFMATIYYGAMYGGSLSSILINTPGDGSAVAATFDGYQMAKQGRAGPAIAITAIGSLIGGAVAVIGFMFLAKPLASFALQFGPAEYFLLMLFTLSAVVALSTGNLVKGFISMGFGLMLSTIGIDLQTGVYRFTFDNVFLSDGIDFLVIIIGVYAIGEVLYNYLTIDKPAGKKTKYGRVWITKDDWKRSKWPIFRSSPLGFLVGILPGAGGSIASMMAYSTEKQLSKKPERFGKGAIEGLAAPETANNSAAVGAFVPLLTMGIPGSGTTAIMLGALIMLGINPGPLLFESDPNMVWSLVDALFLGNIFLFLINIYMVRVFVKVLDIPSKILYPIILVLAFIGAYTMNYAIIDFYILIIFGVIGLFMKLYDFPIAPLVLALIVGSQMEQNFRKSIVASDGSLDIFVGSPIAIVLLILTILSLIYPLIMNVLRKKWEAKTDEQSSL
ncbi:tripartite tricarboxylate transporter permease [Pallidibacillus thermolactis]|uniref:tripartite tricarboxylate transporter permease n=1 Tax=Pallidibacillus thermolactis TaxID=251051 RepID=UPI0021D9EB09|nr:tripartite tricarboxylate transporter permease [Pallidibacillus thermolactis]MCU9599976.1 tripartite tricarboxylate transporter permease [Pallidibacillus thermolactis subsp. kokeshiiformis]